MGNKKTTVQLDKDTLTDLNKVKLNHEAKLGKRMSMNAFVKELIKELIK